MKTDQVPGKICERRISTAERDGVVLVLDTDRGILACNLNARVIYNSPDPRFDYLNTARQENPRDPRFWDTISGGVRASQAVAPGTYVLRPHSSLQLVEGDTNPVLRVLGSRKISWEQYVVARQKLDPEVQGYNQRYQAIGQEYQRRLSLIEEARKRAIRAANKVREIKQSALRVPSLADVL